MLGGCFSFAWMGVFAHRLGETSDWRLAALARSFLVLVFAACLAWRAGARLVFWRPSVLWMRSLAGSLSLVCTFFALSRLPTSEVLTLTNTFPIWVALLSWPVLGERPSFRVVVAACCGVVGVRLLLQGQQYSKPPADAEIALGLALVAAFASSVAMLGLHQLRGIDSRAIVVHFSLVATGITLLACFWGTMPAWETLLAVQPLLLLLGVGVTATIGQLFLTLAFTFGSPARVSVVALTQVLFALGIDLLLGSDSPNGWMLTGMGLVLAPTAWVLLSTRSVSQESVGVSQDSGVRTQE